MKKQQTQRHELPAVMKEMGFQEVTDTGVRVVYRLQLGREMFIDADALTDGVNDGCWAFRVHVWGLDEAGVALEHEPVGTDEEHSLMTRMWYCLRHARRQLMRRSDVQSVLRIACLSMAMDRLDAVGRRRATGSAA